MKPRSGAVRRVILAYCVVGVSEVFGRPAHIVGKKSNRSGSSGRKTGRTDGIPPSPIEAGLHEEGGDVRVRSTEVGLGDEEEGKEDGGKFR